MSSSLVTLIVDQRSSGKVILIIMKENVFEPLKSDNGLHQLISEPTHLIGRSQSFIDQPNLVIESGVHPSLRDQCHHQIIFGKLSVSNKTPPPFNRKIWYYDKANSVTIRKSIEAFAWHKHLGGLTCPDEQVKPPNEVLLNIYSNFIPNKCKTIKPCQAPWITKAIKNHLRKTNRAYKSFVNRGHPHEMLEGIQKMKTERAKLIKKLK